MGGGRQQGPSKAQVQAQQNQELAMMQMNQQMNQQQMAMQQSMLQAQIDAAERQRVAAEKAAQEAAIQSQSSMAQQAAQQNMQDVEQKLTGKNVMQELADQNAAKAYNKSLTTGAENMTGNFDFAKSKQNALQQLGAASGTLPQSTSNTLSNIYGLNPAATTAATALNKTGNTKDKNQYIMPNTSGLTFGGT
jgi:FKBP-type peptidyl-prolyl cis-trans isomerase (trigger factor)